MGVDELTVSAGPGSRVTAVGAAGSMAGSTAFYLRPVTDHVGNKVGPTTLPRALHRRPVHIDHADRVGGAERAGRRIGTD